MTLSAFELRIGRGERRRDDREILRHVVGDRERRERTRASSASACRSRRSRSAWSGWSRDRPCCRLPWRPACRCSSPPRRRPAPAPARRWCRRPSWRRAGPAPGARGSASSFASGVASARKSSTPASAAIAAAVSRLSPVIMTVLMPMRRSSAKRSLMPPLTMSFSSMTPSTRVPSATTSGVEPRRATLSTTRLHFARGSCPPCDST